MSRKNWRLVARERGPGPARYSVPPTLGYDPHVVTKHQAPAYSIRKQLPDYRIKEGPGPVYFVSPGLTHHGKDGPPAYSLSYRHKELSPFVSPTATTYHLYRAHTYVPPRAPEYSMATRCPYQLGSSAPAPNRYTLPTTLGPRLVMGKSAPCFSMVPRSKRGCYNQALFNNPASTAYEQTQCEVTHRRPPHYSIRRQMPPPSLDQRPGPASHRREDVVVNLPRAAAFSFGQRHSGVGMTVYLMR